jgi:hypothetical protein
MYIEESYRLYAIFLIRKPYINELIVKSHFNIPNKRYFK